MAPFPIWTKQLSRPFGGMSPHIRAGCGVDAFAFEHAKETLSRRVVRATAYRTHAAGDVVRLQNPLVFFRCELTAAIGMQE
jgi:hypothetical protein